MHTLDQMHETVLRSGLQQHIGLYGVALAHVEQKHNFNVMHLERHTHEAQLA